MNQSNKIFLSKILLPNTRLQFFNINNIFNLSIERNLVKFKVMNDNNRNKTMNKGRKKGYMKEQVMKAIS